MLNLIWIGFILVGFVAALVQALQGDVEIFSRVLSGLFDSAKTGFDISLGLVGVMSLWLGVMKIGEKGGVIQLFGRALAPFFRRVFPDIPAGHPASGSIVMNFSANVLGLDNAATPLGLKAMSELQEINPQKDTASNAMIMFLVLNTAGITLIPTSVIAMRQTLAIKQGLIGFNAADIFLPTLLATFISFCAGLVAVAIWQRINLFCRPILFFFAGFLTLVAALYAWLSGMPAEQMTQMIGLLGSGLIVSIIVLFVGIAAYRRINLKTSVELSSALRHARAAGCSGRTDISPSGCRPKKTFVLSLSKDGRLFVVQQSFLGSMLTKLSSRAPRKVLASPCRSFPTSSPC